MSATDPISTECSNPNRDDHWTCPACYEDLSEGYPGTHTCSNCGHKSECTVEMTPYAKAVLIEADDA